DRKDLVGELLEADESLQQEQQQQQQLGAAAAAVWRFAAANLEPQQLQALKEAANSPTGFSPKGQQANLLLQQAVQRLRQAELQRVLQQQPAAAAAAAAAADPAKQQQLLEEHSPLLRLVTDACAV
ncbi:hypothetical protein ENH_00022320, partial [Eimeria necatrix]